MSFAGQVHVLEVGVPRSSASNVAFLSFCQAKIITALLVERLQTTTPHRKCLMQNVERIDANFLDNCFSGHLHSSCLHRNWRDRRRPEPNEEHATKAEEHTVR